MSDLLIKNLKLPKEGSIHIRINSEGNVDIYGEYCSHLGRLVDCKAMELTEYGDLIDRDKLAEQLNGYCTDCKGHRISCWVDNAKHEIEKAPVVLPKSGS